MSEGEQAMVINEEHDLKKGERLFKVRNPKDQPLKNTYLMESFTNSGVIYQILEYEDGKFQCACPDHFYRHRECKHIRRIKYPPIAQKITDLLELRLEEDRINIYVDGILFNQCKYLLLINPQDNEEQEDINSIDEAKARLSNKLERSITPRDLGITPHEEFWAHCSNLQAWVDHRYDTRLLHSNLSFPLLKRLTEAGDSLAKKVFKDEIAYRIESNYAPVIIYLIKEGYMNYFNDGEKEMLLEGPAKDILSKFFG